MQIIVRRFVHSGLVWLTALIVVNMAYAGWSWVPARSEAPIPRPQLASIGPSFRLLAEIPFQQIKPPAEPRQAVIVEEDPAPTAVVCRVWGPINSRTELEKVEADIASAGGEFRVTESTVPDGPDYLVYIGVPGQAQDARRVLKELKSQAIDSALITQGRFNNTLSVGVFSRAARAQRQMRKVAKLGYDAQIEEIDRSRNVFHLEARVSADFEPAVSASGPCREIAQAHQVL